MRDITSILGIQIFKWHATKLPQQNPHNLKYNNICRLHGFEKKKSVENGVRRWLKGFQSIIIVIEKDSERARDVGAVAEFNG